MYGAPRVHAQLAREGTFVDRKTVARSMLRQGLEGISEEEVHPGDHHRRCGRLQDPWPGQTWLGPG
ncbi:IS3 family transposase [uncultured Corynebacterium sp.]|uniref:IS3 family transposase n=1 Tax=uncultured Corynebacterium sp. TaxID=159447 RepID=UPI0025D59EE2|nr:IS3 family transposase [uncultured Corynebacterium sp.]